MVHLGLTEANYYTLQETLYLMRWTFDGVEFFRYVPKEEPAARSFDTSGVIVDVNIYYLHSLCGARSCGTVEITGNHFHCADAEIKFPQCHYIIVDTEPDGCLSVRSVGRCSPVSHTDRVGTFTSRRAAGNGTSDEHLWCTRRLRPKTISSLRGSAEGQLRCKSLLANSEFHMEIKRHDFPGA